MKKKCTIIDQDNKEVLDETECNAGCLSNHELWTLLDSAHFAISRVRLLEIAQYGLTREQAQILYIINTKGGSATVNQISEFSMRQLHSISSLISRMVEAGLVKKVKSSREKVFRVVMTRKGEEKYNKLTRESIDLIFSVLQPEAKVRLTESLNELQKTARNLLGLDRKPSFLKVPAETDSYTELKDQEITNSNSK
jgi:DNA-binding MarR family transcriptional regulator